MQKLLCIGFRKSNDEFICYDTYHWYSQPLRLISRGSGRTCNAGNVYALRPASLLRSTVTMRPVPVFLR